MIVVSHVRYSKTIIPISNSFQTENKQKNSEIFISLLRRVSDAGISAASVKLNSAFSRGIKLF
jgi:hypothetical protein